MSEPGNVEQGFVFFPLLALPGSPLHEEHTMSEAEPAGFSPSYPCCIFATPDVDGGLSEDSMLLMVRDYQDRITLPVFTDPDLAERYHSASEDMPRRVLILSFDTKEQLADILDVAHSQGIAFVAFDPEQSDGPIRRSWPVAYAAERIRKGLDLL